jgi:hypothetical protein
VCWRETGVACSSTARGWKDGAIVEAVAFFDTVEFNDFWARVKPAAAAGR